MQGMTELIDPSPPSRSYKTKYVHEYLARGLSPETLHDFMKQRLRWGGGAVEIFFYHNSIWRQVG